MARLNPILEPPKALVVRDPEHPMGELEHELGPEMAKLTKRARAFVMALVEIGGRSQTEAAELAGYTGSQATLGVTASRLAADPRVQAALVEEAQALAKASSFHAVAVCVQIMGDETASKNVRLSAAAKIMGLAGMDPGQKITVDHNHGVAKGTAEEIARVMELCRDLNIDPVKMLGKAGITVDAEFEVVGDRTGLEDLL